jgi:hypothetical protein
VKSGLTISRIHLYSRLSIPEPVFPSACGYLKTNIAHVVPIPDSMHCEVDPVYGTTGAAS